MWNRLSNGWQFSISFIGIVVGVALFSLGIMYLDNNGARVRTDNLWATEAPKDMKMPIEVKGIIEYDGDYIYSRKRIVEFCDVKQAKKEMRKEMKAYWKEMKEGCN